MVKSLKIALGIIVGIVLVSAALLVIRGDEDAWICTSGGWAKHGNPSAAMPAAPCPPGSGEPAPVPADPYSPAAKADKIRITSPASGSLVSSPLPVTGEARGSWYFEASFPVELRAANGTLLAVQPAQAKSDWMTEQFVPFEATLAFPPQAPGSAGTLVLKKDNPSGLPEHDDEVRIPVRF